MNFTYIGANLPTTIKNFSIVDNKLNITFLNNDISEESYTKEKEKMILEKMIDQASERMNKSNVKKLKRSYSKLCFLSNVRLFNINDKLSDKKIKIRELEKYQLYLENITKFQNVPESILFNGVSKKSNDININTLDAYTYSEIKKMLGNIIKYYNSEIMKLSEQIDEVEIILEEIEHEKRK